MIPKMDPKYPHNMKSAADKTPACRGFVIALFVLWGYFGPIWGIIFDIFFCVFLGVFFGTIFGTYIYIY